MVTWNLGQIISKVRNVTGTPSQDQLTDTAITDYINTYYTFTMPFELKEQINLQPFNFQTLANQDVYTFTGLTQTEQPMAYADGFPLIFYSDRDIFFQDWPQQYASDNIATGTGALTQFSGTTGSFPVIQRTFVITDGTQILTDSPNPGTISQGLNFGNGTTGPYTGTLSYFPIQPGTFVATNLVEIFTDNGNGTLTGNAGGTGTINYTTGAYSMTFNASFTSAVQITSTYSVATGSGILVGNGTGTINYVTGAFVVIFTTAPASTATIYDKYQAYQPARPQGVLLDSTNISTPDQISLTFRPIPDQVYAITLQGYIVQNQLTSVTPGTTDTPLQTEWGVLIAYGASLEIFSDRGDIGAYNTYYPILKRYENVALGRFVQQLEVSQSIPRF